jgi:C-terminal processing protease CtpA/Prc
MIKKQMLFGFIFFISLNLFSQNKVNYLWPIKNTDVGKGIIVKPQDYIENELNFGNLFITANEGEIVVAPHSGIIKNFGYTYRKTLIDMRSYRHKYNDSLSIEEFDIEYRKAAANHYKVNAKNISISIGIQTPKGDIYYISGIRPTEYFKTGAKIIRGQTIGRVGYSFHKIEKPSIWFSKSAKSKVEDPMSVFGINSTFVPYQKDKINYLKFKHPISKLKKDFIVFRESLEEGHPGLYDYITKVELDNLFDKTYTNILKPLTSEEFRLSLLPILRAIKDSHTALYSNKYKISDKTKLPILFGIMNDSLIIYSALETENKFLHKSISKINKRDVHNIISEVKLLLYGNDGFVKSHDKRILMLDFWKYYKKSKSFNKGDEVEFQFIDGSSHTFKYDFYDNKTYLPKLKEKSQSRFILKKIDSTIGLIDLNTFQLLETDLDSIGDFISNPTLEHLIIDVRDNSGGDIDAIKKIYSFIAKKPFRLSSYRVVNKKGRYDLFKNSLNYLPNSKLFQNYKKVENKDGYYFPDENIPTVKPNQEYHFNKEVYVLTNEFSKSASTVFPALVYKQKRGLVNGRETGSSYYQLNAVKFVQIYLKNTGLELFMPLVKSVFDTKGNSDISWGRGVLPDKIIKISYNEFLGSNDVFLDETLEFIKNKKQKNNLKSNTPYFIFGSCIMLLGYFIFRQIKRKRNI